MVAVDQNSPTRALGRAFDEFIRYTRPRFRGDGLNGPEAMAIAHLYRLQGRGQRSNPSCISERLAVSRPAVTAILNSLEEKECLHRHPDPQDRRRQEVALTPRGAELAQQILAQYDQMMEEILAALQPEEAQELTRLLQKVADHIKINRREQEHLCGN